MTRNTPRTSCRNPGIDSTRDVNRGKVRRGSDSEVKLNLRFGLVHWFRKNNYSNFIYNPVIVWNWEKNIEKICNKSDLERCELKGIRTGLNNGLVLFLGL